MATLFSEQLPHAEGFIISEQEGFLSREQVTVFKFPTAIPVGTLMAVRDDGKYHPLQLVSSEGNTVAAGILCSEVDAIAADAKGVIIERLAEVRLSDLIYPAGASQGQKDTFNAQLLTRNIKVRAVATTVSTQTT